LSDAFDTVGQLKAVALCAECDGASQLQHRKSRCGMPSGASVRAGSFLQHEVGPSITLLLCSDCGMAHGKHAPIAVVFHTSVKQACWGFRSPHDCMSSVAEFSACDDGVIDSWQGCCGGARGGLSAILGAGHEGEGKSRGEDKAVGQECILSNSSAVLLR